jgi:hypothetical protein
MHAGVQAQKGDETSGACEAIDRPDCRQQSNGDDHVYPGNCHEPFCLCAAQLVACELAFNDPEIVRQSIILANMALDRSTLIIRQQLRQQPGASFGAEDVRVWALRHEMGMEDRLDHRF